MIYMVYGGEVDLKTDKFLDITKVEFIGFFPDQGSAAKAWRGRSYQTVDNAIMRFYIHPLDVGLVNA